MERRTLVERRPGQCVVKCDMGYGHGTCMVMS